MNRNSLTELTDEQLFKLLRSTKSGVLKAIDHGAAYAPSFHIGISVLEIFEKEVRRRGFDPSDEKKFGRDIIGELVAEKIKEAASELSKS